ncbi:MAG: OmpA family protein [Planctomycetes bacterium]|nr:OmpA family protein [Planctomycetota bacterium]
MALYMALCMALPACVPYQYYENQTGELNKANEVNRNLEGRMRAMGADLALAQGAGGISGVQNAALQDQLESVRLENATLRQKAELLEKRLREIPEAGPGEGVGGFDPKQFSPDLGEGIHFDEGAIVLDEDLLFGSGKSELRDASKKALDRIAEVIKSQHGQNVIHIVGHTDNKPIVKSDNKDNWDLGAKRAHAVFQFLTKQKSLPDTHFRIHSHGFATPFKNVDPNSAAGQAKCRRVEIRLGPEIPR